MSLSTSSSNCWRSFAFVFLGVLITLLSIIYITIVMIDPFDNLPVSPELNRVQVSGSDRFFKPSVARRPNYDSAIIGTSSVMLINPERLGKKLDAKFATLAMPAASAFEQLRLLKLFAKHHSKIRQVFVGVDHAWCKQDRTEQLLGANIGNRIPDELYDENHWNNWPRLSGTMIKYTKRQWKALHDDMQEPAGHDGFFDFTREYPPYDLRHVQSKLYKNQNPLPKPGSVIFPEISEDKRRTWIFPDLMDLQRSLSSLPTETKKVLIFVPFHWYEQSRSFSTFEECKKRVIEWDGQVENLYVIDFMRNSDITLEDNNYWDPIHFVRKIAENIESVVAETLKGNRISGKDYNYLLLPEVVSIENQ